MRLHFPNEEWEMREEDGESRMEREMGTKQKKQMLSSYFLHSACLPYSISVLLCGSYPDDTAILILNSYILHMYFFIGT